MAKQLTRKDFEAIAASLRDLQAAVVAIAGDELPGADARIARTFYHAAKDIAVVLAQTNGKFDSERFIDGCKVQ